MKAEIVVADSGAFIRNASLQDFSEKVFTCGEVISEIRDSATKRRLQVLSYELKLKDPAPKYIRKVIEISKEIGDYHNLSSTDIKVIALTYQLQCEHDHDPLEDSESIEAKKEIQFGSNASRDLPGFYIPKSSPEEDIEKVTEELKDTVLDEDGWITPAMLREMEGSKKESLEEKQPDKVVCLTTDFAMQNVLLKMKLKIYSVDGMLIENVRSYIKRCFSCFKTTTDMSKRFCPACGNDTLKRVPIQIQEDGSVKMFLSRNPKVLSKRGKKYSLPTPRGGKHAVNPILCEDQRIPQNYPSRKSLQKTNVWSEDFDGSNPFAKHDVCSQAFRIGVASKQHQRRNFKRYKPK